MNGISVVMPVYNVSDLLYTSIESIQKQTLKDVEIICVDDGSTDDSLEILTKLQEKYNNIKIIEQENAGPGIARNTGIGASEGEYIAFLDADDIFLDETALERMYEVAKKTNSNMVGANLKFINRDYSLNENYDYINTRFKYYSKEDTLESEQYGIPFAFYKNIYNKDFINKYDIRFPDKRAGEDPVFMANVLVNTKTFPALPIDLYGYNHSMGGGVNEKINNYEKKYSYIEHFKEVFDILKNNNLQSTYSGYKVEFIDYLIYSKNMYDKEIQEILSKLFNNYEDYFQRDSYGYFVMDYMLNPDYTENFSNYDEFALIKKCLFEETFIADNFIDKERLIDYLKIQSNNRYDVDDSKLQKASYNILNNIKQQTAIKHEAIHEEIEAVNNKINSETYGKYAEFLRKFNECRIDVKNIGSSENRIEVVDCDDPLCDISNPVWLRDEEGEGSVIYSVQDSLNISFKCVNDGTLMLSFKGIDYRDKLDKRIPVYIDFTEIVVDGETLVRGSRVSWHDNPVELYKDVKDGQIVNIRLKWLPLNYNSDLRLLSDYEKVINVLSNSRIDVKNMGNPDNRVEIVDCDDSFCDISNPLWIKDDTGIGTVLNSASEHMNFSFKCVNDGTLMLSFKGVDYRDKSGNRIPVFIDYNEIIVDGKRIVKGSRVSWHDDSYDFYKDVKDGQIVKVQVKWQPLHSGSNLNLLSREDKRMKIFNMARIDIKNNGNNANTIEILEKDDSSLKIVRPDWFKNDKGIGTELISQKGNLNISFKCVNDGNLNLEFRAIHHKEDNIKVPVYINYSEIVIDDEVVLNSDRATWHDDPFIFNKQVKDGQIVNVKVKWNSLNKSASANAVFNEQQINNIKNAKKSKNNEIAKLKQQLKTLKQENKELEHFKEEVLSSNSWKITEPLRKIKDGK